MIWTAFYCKTSAFGDEPRRMLKVIQRFGKHCRCHLRDYAGWAFIGSILLYGYKHHLLITYSFTFYGLGPQASFKSELTSEITKFSRHFIGLHGLGISQSQGLFRRGQHNTGKRAKTSTSRAGFEPTILVFYLFKMSCMPYTARPLEYLQTCRKITLITQDVWD
jgi:hypothetical protein